MKSKFVVFFFFLLLTLNGVSLGNGHPQANEGPKLLPLHRPLASNQIPTLVLQPHVPQGNRKNSLPPYLPAPLWKGQWTRRQGQDRLSSTEGHPLISPPPLPSHDHSLQSRGTHALCLPLPRQHQPVLTFFSLQWPLLCPGRAHEALLMLLLCSS